MLRIMGTRGIVLVAMFTALLVTSLFVTPIVHAATCPVIITRLSLGSNNQQVIELKKFLVADGATGPNQFTTYFGLLTQAALQKWQCKKGIVCSGTSSTTGYGATGPVTRKVLRNCGDFVGNNRGTGTTVITYSWNTSTWSECIDASQSRTVTCVSPQNQSVSDTYCSSNKPATTRSCSVTTLPQCIPLQAETRIQSCSVGQTGTITQTRTSTCPGPQWSDWSTTGNTCAATLPGTTPCTLDGLVVAEMASQTFYSAHTVPYGQNCTSVAQTRACANGIFSGSDTYHYASCIPQQPAQCAWNGSFISHGTTITANLSSTVPYGQQCQTEQRTCTNGTLYGSYAFASCTPQTAQCILPTPVTETRTSTPCPSGQTGIIIETRSATCPLGATTPQWSTWQVQSNTCAATVIIAPTNLQAQCSSNGQQVTLSWNPSVGAQNYGIRILQEGSQTFGEIKDWYPQTTYTTSAIIPGLSMGWWVHANPSTGTLGPATSPNLFTCYPPNPPQNLLVNSFDAYSPEPVFINGQLKMYFGGWYTPSDLPHDGIFIADCDSGGGSCTNIRKVIDPVTSGYYQVNDPSIVLHPAFEGSPAYYIMYMTCNTENMVPGAHDSICYATSYDGMAWSALSLLMENHWLPSAVWKNDHIELWANDNSNGQKLQMFNLGYSGVGIVNQIFVTQDNGASNIDVNVNVEWRPTLNIYQIFGERAISGNSSVIDYLDSIDGFHWNLRKAAVIQPQPGSRVGTPAQHPDNTFVVFFGQTTDLVHSMAFKIYSAQWSM